MKIEELKNELANFEATEGEKMAAIINYFCQEPKNKENRENALNHLAILSFDALDDDDDFNKFSDTSGYIWSPGISFKPYGFNFNFDDDFLNLSLDEDDELEAVNYIMDNAAYLEDVKRLLRTAELNIEHAKENAREKILSAVKFKAFELMAEPEVQAYIENGELTSEVEIMSLFLKMTI